MRTTFKLLKISLILIIGLVGQVWAQSTALKNEQAKLVSKFAQQINWPSDVRQTKFIIGVYKDKEKYKHFSEFFANKGIKGKDIVISLIEEFSKAKDINVLYLSSNQRSSLTSVNDRINNTSILIVTEDSKEPHKSMIDISYNEQRANISFRVNDAKIKKQQLIIPDLSELLDAKNTTKPLPFGPSFIQKDLESKKLLALQNKLTQQETSLEQLNKKLNLSNKSSEKYNLALQKEVARLQLAQKENANKSKEIESRDERLQYLQKQLQAQIKINKQGIVASDDDITKAEEIEAAKKQKQLAQDKAIADLNESIKKQKEITNNFKIKLNNLTNDNKVLSGFKMLFYACLLIAIVALLVAIIIWRKSKNLTSIAPLPSNTEHDTLLPIRNRQLAKSENLAALGYIATDTTYSVGLYLEQLQTQLESTGDIKSITMLKPVVTLLNNFNLIAADQDETKIQNFDIIAYINKMIMLYGFEFKQSNITYLYSGEKTLTVKSIPSHIALILLNIINNSLKHGFDNNGNGKLTLHIEKNLKSGAKITLSDDGQGMNKNVLQQVCEPFFTTQSSRGYVGLGMSTVHGLVKKELAGEIQIESQENKGTKITITLP